MTRLTDALEELQVDGEVQLDGRWATIKGQRCNVYVAEAALGAYHLSWCDDPDERAVEVYNDAKDAIRAGLQRAGS